MPNDQREAAWDAVQEALPARWRPGPALYSPADHKWHVSAIGPHPGRGKVPVSVTGSGEDEVAALRDLDGRLRGVPQPDGSRMEELYRRQRLAFLEGAEDWSQRERDRGLTIDELDGVIGRYLGDEP